MSNEELQKQPNPNDLGSAGAGNPVGEGNDPVKSGEAGESSENSDVKTQYENLEQKFGEQGQELGEYRSFMKEIEPLLDKLNTQPELIKMIMEGKLTAELAQAVVEGKVTQAAAEAVTKAHEEVKKEVGKEKFAELSPEKIEKLVAEKVEVVKKDLTKTIEESKSLDNFENYTNDFIRNTPDFVEYADKITAWFEEHPDQDDIKIAYEAVKGRILSEKYKDAEAVAAAEAAKELAANAGGGSSEATGIHGGEKEVDKYIGGTTNPHAFI